MVNMMRSGIMRLDNGGTVPWYMNILGSGSKGDGETPEEKARREFLENWFKNHSLAVPTGQENYDPFAGDTDKAYELWLVYNYEFPGTVPDPTTPTPTPTPTPTTPTPTTPTPTTTTPGAIEEITVTEMEQNGFPPGLTEVFVGGVLFSLIGSGSTGYWANEAGDMYKMDGTPMAPPNTSGAGGAGAGGLLGLGIGPWLKSTFGLDDTAVGDLLSGLFGAGGGIKSLVDLLAKFKAGKGAWDAINYDVPTGQNAARSDYEKANPLVADMSLQGMGPNYLQGQEYGVPVGQQGLPAATHKIAFPDPYVEPVQGAQSGGIMKSHGDIVPALLEPGEFVMTLDAVKGAGNGDAREGAKQMYKIMNQFEGGR